MIDEHYEELLKELRKYIVALKTCRELTETLPYNVPEKLEEFCDKWEAARNVR